MGSSLRCFTRFALSAGTVLLRSCGLVRLLMEQLQRLMVELVQSKRKGPNSHVYTGTMYIMSTAVLERRSRSGLSGGSRQSQREVVVVVSSSWLRRKTRPRAKLERRQPGRLRTPTHTVTCLDNESRSSAQTRFVFLLQCLPPQLQSRLDEQVFASTHAILSPKFP